MSPELDTALCRDFPEIFAQRHGDMRDTCMCWGFPGDGWEPLIRRACERLTRLAMLGDGPVPTAVQVKEKYGSLRFYVDGATDLADLVIDRAEFDSHHVCEQCGAGGKIRRRGGWLACRCASCAAEAKYPVTEDEAEDLGLKAGEFVSEDAHE